MDRSADLRPLVGVAGMATVLGVAGLAPVWPGSAHHAALPPLDLFADVRVLLADSPSHAAFVASLVTVVAVRVVVLAAMLRALNRSGLIRAAHFYGLALPVALVAGGLAYSGVAAVYSPFLWVGVAIAAAALLAMGPRPWRREAARHSTAKSFCYLAALLVLSFLSSVGGTGVRLVLVWVSSALTAATIRWLGRAGTGNHRPAPGRPRAACRFGARRCRHAAVDGDPTIDIPA